MELLVKVCVCLTVMVIYFCPEYMFGKPVKNGKCEYDLDLVDNNIRVVCQGKNAQVNIYASNAEMQQAGIIPSHGDQKPMRAQRDSAHSRAHVVDFRHATPMSEYIWNATRKMERLKRKLSRHSNSLTNISKMLATSDENLRLDIEHMRRMQYNSVTLKDAMLAAIQNQYNFMRTAILTQNFELSKMMDSLQIMVDVTARSLQSAARSETELYSQIAVVNQTMLTMRRMLSRELKKKRRRRPEVDTNMKGKCPQQIIAIGSGDVIDVKGKRGTFMKDVSDDTGTIYIMQGAGTSDRLVEFESEIDLEYNYVSITFNLPFKCKGTGHVVFRGCLYCQKEASNKIIKYKLSRMERMGELDIAKTGISNSFPNEFTNDNDINLAVDEYGLWAIYTTPDAAGKIMVSKINDATFEIENTWLTSYPSNLAHNTFMICGVVYAVESFAKTPTYVKYVFDTNTSKDKVLKEGTLFFPALSEPNVDVATLDYNYKDGTIYAWGGGKVYAFFVFLEEGSQFT